MNQAANSQFDFLRSILERPKDVITFSVDTRLRYLTFSQSHKELMKAIWGLEISIGTCILDFILNDNDKQKAKHNFDRALQGEYFTLVEEYGKLSQKRFFYEDR